jgi:hypothetical protein
VWVPFDLIDEDRCGCRDASHSPNLT